MAVQPKAEHIINWPECIKRCSGHESLAREMLDMFFAELKNVQQNILSLYAAGDRGPLIDAVHKLNGGLCYCAVPELQAISKPLETALRNNEGKDLAAQLDALDQAISQALAVYQQHFAGD